MDFFSNALFGGVGVKTHAPGFLEGVVSDVLQSVLGNFVRGSADSELRVPPMGPADVWFAGTHAGPRKPDSPCPVPMAACS